MAEVPASNAPHGFARRTTPDGDEKSLLGTLSRLLVNNPGGANLPKPHAAFPGVQRLPTWPLTRRRESAELMGRSLPLNIPVRPRHRSEPLSPLQGCLAYPEDGEDEEEDEQQPWSDQVRKRSDEDQEQKEACVASKLGSPAKPYDVHASPVRDLSELRAAGRGADALDLWGERALCGALELHFEDLFEGPSAPPHGKPAPSVSATSIAASCSTDSFRSHGPSFRSGPSSVDGSMGPGTPSISGRRAMSQTSASASAQSLDSWPGVTEE